MFDISAETAIIAVAVIIAVGATIIWACKGLD